MKGFPGFSLERRNKTDGLRLSPSDSPEMSIEGLEILLPPDVAARLFTWCYAIETEVHCLGTAERVGQHFIVTNLWLPRQTSAATGTEADEGDIWQMLEELRNEQGWSIEETPALRVIAHSHPGMSSRFSATDDAKAKEFVSDWLINLCVADDYEVRGRIDFRVPFKGYVNNVPVCLDLRQQDSEALIQEVKNKVKVAKGIVLPSPVTGTTIPAAAGKGRQKMLDYGIEDVVDALAIQDYFTEDELLYLLVLVEDACPAIAEDVSALMSVLADTGDVEEVATQLMWLLEEEFLVRR